MKLSTNEIQILLFLSSATQYTSSYELAENTGIHRRLIREYIGSIKIQLEAEGYELISKPSKGYIINPVAPNTTQTLHRRLKSLVELNDATQNYPQTQQERVDFMAQKLLTNTDFINTEYFMNALYISSSTVSKDLKEFKKAHEKYDITIVHKYGTGRKVVGAELDLREALEDRQFQEFRHTGDYFSLLEDIPNITYLNQIVINALNHFNLDLTDTSLTDFILCLVVCIKRITMGCYLDPDITLDELTECKELDVSHKIAQDIFETFDIYIPEYEIIRITIELLGKKLSLDYPIVYAETLTEAIVTELQNITYINFTANSFFYNRFLSYVKSTLFRQKYHTKLRNPFYKEILEQYIYGYELSKIVSEIFQKHSFSKLSNSELSFFTLLFQTSLGLLKPKKIKALLISGLSASADEYNIGQILERFRSQIVIEKKVQEYKMQFEPLETYELIISSGAIPEQSNIPFIRINPLIEAEDIQAIQNFLIANLPPRGIENSLHNNLFTVSSAKSKTNLINEFQRLIDNEHTTKTTSVRTIFEKKQGVIYENKQDVCIFRYDKAFSSLKNTIAVITTKTPITLFNQPAKLFILLSYQDTVNTIEADIYNLLIAKTKAPENMDKFWDNPNYYSFLQLLNNF